ncbi:MAG: hypothetical protein LBO09_00795 [Candidatus Peribacteria bacterium]|nr:hypothetical protein [Candidatus Peribacteria bacterium]
MAVGFLRQGLKLLRPDFFSWIGYELHLNDRQFDQKPPLYYLTGWEGTLRRQGLFSGPNNYGYFLVAFFPVILSFTRQHRDQKASQRLKLGILFIWILAMLMTLSRAVIL